MCFCQKPGFDSEQNDTDPAGFTTFAEDPIIGYTFQFDYYNHRLDQSVFTEGNDFCVSKPVEGSLGVKNECLDWGPIKRHFCSTCRFGSLPEGIKQKDWDFCYYFHGAGEHRDRLDEFAFGTGKRGVPFYGDYSAPKDVVDKTCKDRCFNKMAGMERFDTKKGGVFNQITGYHHFDDICTKHMACDKWTPRHP
ncbi:MAG: hypothetical protein LQ350_003463 [Teloschistes chrysophthalmus]|nr:MAG: hypothetical protein LQ350_003463 [Niorma chrysophthalma]